MQKFFAGIRPNHREKVRAQLLQQRDGGRTHFRSIVVCVQRGNPPDDLYTRAQTLIDYDTRKFQRVSRPPEWHTFMETVRTLQAQEEAYYELSQKNETAWMHIQNVEEKPQGYQYDFAREPALLDVASLLVQLQLFT